MAKEDNFVGIQIGAISFIDEGLTKVFDTIQEKAGANAIFVSALSWSRGNAGRPDPSWGYADHGVAKEDHLIGGAFFNPNPEYYKNTFLREFKAPDKLYEGFDALGDVAPEAHKRDVKLYAYYCETAHKEPRVPVINFPQIAEVDAYGRKATRPCLLNPDYRSWTFSIFEDMIRSYDMDGILWGIERQSALMNMIDGDVPTCFCEHCRTAAARKGIDAERAREGYIKFDKFLQRVRAGEIPNDGVFVTGLRIILDYPEIMHWEKMWNDAHKSLYRELSGVVKFMDPKCEFGLGMWQEINTFNPYLRAQYDFSELARYADFVKPVLYHIPAGLRFVNFAKRWNNTIMKDLSLDETVEFLKRVMQLNEAGADELPETGFSAGYVQRQTANLVNSMGGNVPVYPGIGVGVANVGGKKITPDDAKAAVKAAYEGGAKGIMISRNYSETQLDLLEAVGDALRELGKL